METALKLFKSKVKDLSFISGLLFTLQIIYSVIWSFTFGKGLDDLQVIFDWILRITGILSLIIAFLKRGLKL